jgi:hypothetical protein
LLGICVVPSRNPTAWLWNHQNKRVIYLHAMFDTPCLTIRGYVFCCWFVLKQDLVLAKWWLWWLWWFRFTLKVIVPCNQCRYYRLVMNYSTTNHDVIPFNTCCSKHGQSTFEIGQSSRHSRRFIFMFVLREAFVCVCCFHILTCERRKSSQQLAIIWLSNQYPP